MLLHFQRDVLNVCGVRLAKGQKKVDATQHTVFAGTK